MSMTPCDTGPLLWFTSLRKGMTHGRRPVFYCVELKKCLNCIANWSISSFDVGYLLNFTGWVLGPWQTFVFESRTPTLPMWPVTLGVP